ncbi:MAG: tetratricopeptide repeat protein [Hassallia sp.]
MTFLDSLNALSKTLLGVGIVDAWKQAPQTKTAKEKAEGLAQNKHLREAVITAQKALAAWSGEPGFWERLIQQLFLGNILDQLKEQLKQWRRQVAEVEKLAANAKALIKQDTGNPLETQVLEKAIAIYEQISKIICDERISETLNQCKHELERRSQFQKLVRDGEFQAENRFYQKAIAAYRQAEQLYRTEGIIGAIVSCEAHVKQEKIYYSAFEKAQLAEKEGRLRSAIALLQSALANFQRSDGLDLLQKLENILNGREKFRAGLQAEKAGKLKEAETLYQAAKVLLPSTECYIRLAIVAIKTENWATALSHLEGISGQAAYLRGFALAKQGNLQAAHKEWHPLAGTTMQAQKEIIKSLSFRQRLLALQNIEQLVNDENLEQAKTASTAFIKKFGSDSLVEVNLNEHIQPGIEAAIWQGNDWGIIADKSEKIWIDEPNLTTLHNWVVATYYHSQSYVVETRLIASLHDLIIGLSTALVNLTDAPSLKDLPWLGNQAVDLESVSLELKRKLEEAIDNFKDKNLKEYLNLRDRYRLEMVALRLMSNPPKWGMKLKDVFVTPGCYNRYYQNWQNILVDNIDNQNILRSLYTPWGLTVAACQEGDTQRAMQLKPTSKPTTVAETFAQKFIAYHEGCYHIQQQKWREAIIAFNHAKTEIKASLDWQQEVDRLCGLQRQVISEFQENLEFAQLWYDLLGSKMARSYLAEYKTEQLRNKLANEQISLEKALQELEGIKKIDEFNPIVKDLIENVEIAQELKEIQRLFRNSQFEAMVKRARGTRHERVRFIVTEFIIEILVTGVSNGNLNNPEMILQLGRWAYEISPNEPAFQEVYRSLRLR